MIFFKKLDKTWWKLFFRNAGQRGELFWCVAYFCWCLVVSHKKPINERLAWMDNAHPFWDMRWDRFMLCNLAWCIMILSQISILISTTNKFKEGLAVGTLITISVMSVLCFAGMCYWLYDHWKSK